MNHSDDVTRNLTDSVSTSDEPIDFLDDTVEMPDMPEESEVLDDTSQLNTDDLPINHEPVPELPEQSDPVFQDSECKREECKKTINKGNRFKDILFALTCVIGGLGGLAMVIICVIITCGAISNRNNDKNTISADPNKVEVYYDENGQIHLNVFVDKEPDININVIVDGNGNQSIDAETVNPNESETNDQNSKDEFEQETTESVIEPVTENTTESVTEEVVVETETKTEDKSESTETETETEIETETETEAETETEVETTEDTVNDSGNKNNNGSADNSDDTITKEPEAVITPNDMTRTEYEKYLLEQQEDAAEKGENRYNDSDTAYTIVRGDTLSQISARTGYSIQFLAEYNQIQNPNLIITGEILYIPVI